MNSLPETTAAEAMFASTGALPAHDPLAKDLAKKLCLFLTHEAVDLPNAEAWKAGLTDYRIATSDEERTRARESLLTLHTVTNAVQP